MREKQKVLGLLMNQVSAFEAMEQVQEFMATEALSTIGIITSDVLLEAAKSEKYQAQVEQLDLCLIGDKDVLEAAGIDSAQRRMEVEDNWFLRTFLEYLTQEGISFALLVESEEEKTEALKIIEKQYPNLQITGAFVAGQEKEEADSLVNQINGESPDVILAALSRPYQEEFMAENRTKLLAKIWIGAGKNIRTKGNNELKSKFWERILGKRKRKLSRFLDQEGD